MAGDCCGGRFRVRVWLSRRVPWGYRLLVVDDPDGNQLFFNYPNETASGTSVRDGRETGHYPLGGVTAPFLDSTP
jgi:hypothetical protein